MSAEDAALDLPPLGRRPHLLPYNRRLRHLRAVLIRNLTLPFSVVDAQEPESAYGHHPSAKADQVQHGPSLSSPSSRAPSPSARRKASRTIRRRSTANWVGAAPSVRQKKLEDVTNHRLCNVWFSLHHASMPGPDPIYISEVIHRTMNPSFHVLSLEDCGTEVTRSAEVTLTVWARNMLQQDYARTFAINLDFSSLIYLCKDLIDYRHALPPNTLILQLTDGYYEPLTDPPADISAIPLAPPRLLGGSNSAKTLSSSSLDALFQLRNLDDCIQDALLTRHRLSDQVGILLVDQRESRTSVWEANAAQERKKDVERGLVLAQKRLTATRARTSHLRTDLERRRSALITAYAQQRQIESSLHQAEEDLGTSREAQAQMEAAISQQRRWIAGQLSKTFPIEPLPPPYRHSFLFAIRGWPLPNSDFSSGLPGPDSHLSSSSAAKHKPVKVTASILDRYNGIMVNASALGHVAHLISLLSRTLDIPLPYPITICGSTCCVLDPISFLTDSGTNTGSNHRDANGFVGINQTRKSAFASKRVFPLYQKGTARYRFEYGVFLLNKDVEFLVALCGGRVVDIRDTLGNAKLAVESCGKAVIGPGLAVVSSRLARLREPDPSSGVRGLWKSGLKQSPESPLGSSAASLCGSRRSSDTGSASGVEGAGIEELNDELTRRVPEMAWSNSEGLEKPAAPTERAKHTDKRSLFRRSVDAENSFRQATSWMRDKEMGGHCG